MYQPLWRRTLSNLQKMRDKQVRAAESRAKVQLARARTRQEQDIVRQKLLQDKLRIEKEMYEARTATIKARAAVKVARIEAGDLTMGERVERFGRGLGTSSLAGDFKRAGKALLGTSPKRRPAHRKTAKKHTRK